jgi:hypothetical protein
VPELRRALRADGLHGGGDFVPFSVEGEDDDLGFRLLIKPEAAMSYGEDRLREEAAYIAYHFHWPLEQILNLEHADRRRWAVEISKINERMNEEESSTRVF